MSLLKNKIKNIKDPFWYESPSVLFNIERLDEFFPNKSMILTEQLNALVRLTIYVGIILTLYKLNFNFLYIPIITMVFTYLIYYYSNRNDENFENFYKINDILYPPKKIVPPTQNNPFMNVSMGDYTENPQREALIKLNNYNNEELQKDIDEKFNYNLYKDVDDVFNKYNSQRQFYTTAVTTIPNEQDRFANWCYNTLPTCKEGNGLRCEAGNYNHLKDSKYRNPFM